MGKGLINPPSKINLVIGHIQKMQMSNVGNKQVIVRNFCN